MSLAKIPTRQLGRNGPNISAMGLGTMTISTYVYGKTDTEESYRALTLAADLGMTYWDSSDIYLGSEQLIGKWFSETGRRNEIFLATKFGAADPENPMILSVSSSPSYIRRAVQRSLSMLKTDHIDLYYQHRVDATVPIEIVIETLGEFIDNGKIRWIGLSECSAATLRRAKAVPRYGEKIVALQVEYSPLTMDIEKNGLADTAKELGVSIVAYSPLSRGILSGKVELTSDDWRRTLPRFSDENYEKNMQVAEKFKAIAEKYNATPAQIILAWILADHPDFIPIPGCRSRSRVEENAAAAHINLNKEDVITLRDICESVQALGERYDKALTEITAEDSLPLKDWKGESER